MGGYGRVICVGLFLALARHAKLCEASLSSTTLNEAVEMLGFADLRFDEAQHDRLFPNAFTLKQS
jgi:hypothetical protein